MKRPSIQQALAKENPLVSPSAHDALSARMIEEAGFSSIAIGGSALLAARHALPDLGITALGEMAAGARDILNACKLPCLIDGDDGYGDVKSVARTMAVYEGIGAGGVIFEDQLRAGKQPGDSAANSLASVDEMKAKLRAAVVARDNVDVLLIARTDAYAPEGLDAALARGYEYLSLRRRRVAGAGRAAARGAGTYWLEFSRRASSGRRDRRWGGRVAPR